MRNLWELPLQRLAIYCEPFERPEDYLKVSAHATCQGEDWIGMERYLTVIEETIPFRILQRQEVSNLLWQRVRRPLEFIDADACVLIDQLNKKPNYFHWFLDALPRILAAEHYSQLTNTPFRVVTADTLQPWQWDSLGFLGVQPDALIRAPASRRIQGWECRRLLSSFSHRHVRHSPSGHFDSLSRRAIQSLASRLIAGAGRNATPTAGAKRLYVSRGNVSQRRVANEGEVMAVLAPHGFAMVQLDGMELAEQIQLFQQATHVISAHGGALTNLLFIPPQCQVLEVFQSGHGLRPDFFQLTAVRNGQYSFYAAPSLNAKNDIEIPLAVLRTFLAATL